MRKSPLKRKRDDGGKPFNEEPGANVPGESLSSHKEARRLVLQQTSEEHLPEGILLVLEKNREYANCKHDGRFKTEVPVSPGN